MHSLWEPLFSVVSPSLSVTRHSASPTLFHICSLLHLFLSPRHMLACSHSHTHTLSGSPAGTVSILRGLSVSISQQPRPRGCVLPTLLLREELWRSTFPLSPACRSAPGFIPACKINLWPSPFPKRPYPLSHNGQKQRTRRVETGARAISSIQKRRGASCRPRELLLVRRLLALIVNGLDWRRISMEMEMTPRIIHDTLQDFHVGKADCRGRKVCVWGG